MDQIIFSDLKKWYSQYTDDPDQLISITADLWEKFHLFPKQCKVAIDEVAHTNLEPSLDPVTIKCKEVLKNLSETFGVFSPVYQSIVKMIIDCELDPKDIKKEVKERNVLPAAFVPSIVAHPSFEMWPVVSFVDNIFDKEYESDPIYFDKYTNVLRLKSYIQKKSERFFKRRSCKRRLIKLSNGSSTRIEDEVNVQDLNGSIYIAEEEIQLIQRCQCLLDWLHIDNFKDEFKLLETIQVQNTFGSVNYAPDDSGKTRVSFLIDSCIQVVSKAFHEYLDYLVKDLSCNGTYRQQAVIRNMIVKGRNRREGVILSTDMSKYSDTMQRSYMIQTLEWIGIPPEVTGCLNELYSLPLWDSVLKRTTGRTTASYQGQYGDFPWITLMNIFNQLACYDFVNYTYGTKYYIDLRLKKIGNKLISRNDMNCAVGDDTIMAFPGWKHRAEDLFEIVQAVFNRVGVNINLSKTHWIRDGEGCCDFVKRFITKEGLIPYLRLQSAVSVNLDERCEEMLRFYRDNMVSKEEWDSIVDCFVPPDYAEPLKRLHILNGGIVDSIITPEDIRLFYYKNTVYSRSQALRNKDEIRKWIDMVHRCYDIKLIDTHLISFLVQEISPISVKEEEEEEEVVLWDCEEEEIDWTREVRDVSSDLDSKLRWNFSSWEEVKSSFTEEELIQQILNTNTKGYEYPDFENISRLVGETLESALDKYPDFCSFFTDYQQNEIYRYLYSNSKRNIDVYTRMFKEDYSWLIERNDIYRYPLDRLSKNCGGQLLQVIEKRAIKEHITELCTYWGKDYRYLVWKGKRYRLYLANVTSYDIPPKSAFLYLLGYNESQMTKEIIEKTDSLWNDFCRYMQ
jgi:hypothetical protein